MIYLKWLHDRVQNTDYLLKNYSKIIKQIKMTSLTNNCSIYAG